MKGPARDSEKRQTQRHAHALTTAATDSERQQQEATGGVAHLAMVKVVMYLQVRRSIQPVEAVMYLQVIVYLSVVLFTIFTATWPPVAHTNALFTVFTLFTLLTATWPPVAGTYCFGCRSP
jgi:hypothetical protein